MGERYAPRTTTSQAMDAAGSCSQSRTTLMA